MLTLARAAAAFIEQYDQPPATFDERRVNVTIENLRAEVKRWRRHEARMIEEQRRQQLGGRPDE